MFVRSAAFALSLLLLLVACTPPAPPARQPGDVLSRLEPHFRLFKPAGEAPYRTILFFHSASDMAWYPAQETFIGNIVAQGYAVVYADMYSGRGLNGKAARSGALLPKEVAGDVMVTLDWARRQSWIDGERIAAWGVSLGAAGIMDALTLAGPGRMPTGLNTKPPGGLSGLKAAVLLSPWCSNDIVGFNMLASVHDDFTASVPLLAILPSADGSSDVALCREILERNRAAGATVRIQSYPGAGHTFAQPLDDYGNPFPDYDAALAADAEMHIYNFLGERLQ